MKRSLLIICALYMFTACSRKSNNPVPAPAKALLTSPAANAVCTTGTVISDTQSSIIFTWNSATGAESYVLYVKNLLTSTVTTQTTANTSLTITLARNTPYSWYIVSKTANSTATAQSDTWKFYNSGPGVIAYAPFPAAITSPTLGQTVSAASGTINLTWTGSAVDNSTIVNYDVYFGTTASPPIFKSAITGNFLNGVSVASGTTYYWKVITRDVNGDTSDSGLYQFNVN